MVLVLKCLLIFFLSIQYSQCMPFAGIQCQKDDTNEYCSESNDYPIKYSTNVWKKTLCEFCFLTLPIARDLVDSNRTKYFHNIAAHLCEDLKISNSLVCNMAVSEYETVVLSIVKETELKSSDLCSLSLGCSKIDNPLINWNISLPDTPKPPVIEPILPDPKSPKLRILQLSDIHVDFEYAPGSIANCGEPLCCRNSSTLKKGQTEPQQASYWGEVTNCDIPLWTLENMFDHIAKNEQFDLIYWTGDLPPHNIWNQTRNDSVSALETLTKLFQKYFPNKSIFPTLGNHEAQPCNLFPTPYVKEDNIQWLYSSLAREWTKTGLPNYLNANITRGAFYTLKLVDNLRLISLNTNYCPKENFWLVLNATDPLNQLDWLAKTLQKSEDNKEKVHIIGHIHPSECLDSWSKSYYEIINRYENIISAQIFGHDHQDSFRIFYDLKNTSRAVSVSYLGPSVTTFSNLNPGYRIYTVDGVHKDSSFNILDHETIFMNLTEANKYGTPKWTSEYSAKDAYKLESLFPEAWNKLIYEMLADPFGDSANKLIRFYSKSSDTYDECDLECRKAMFCGLKQSRSDNFVPC